MNPEKLYIVFENCEVAKVPTEKLEFFSLYDVKESVGFNPNGGLHVSKSAGKAVFAIREPDEYTLERCQKYMDIAQLELGTLYFVDWQGDSDYDNPGQHVTWDGKVLTIYINFKMQDEGFWD